MGVTTAQTVAVHKARHTARENLAVIALLGYAVRVLERVGYHLHRLPWTVLDAVPAGFLAELPAGAVEQA
jgi:hypothetical protein